MNIYPLVAHKLLFLWPQLKLVPEQTKSNQIYCKSQIMTKINITMHYNIEQYSISSGNTV